MEKLNYKQAFDKITEAYIKGEIKALDSNFCFCGTLCGNSMDWNYGLEDSPAYNLYSKKEYKRMEDPLLSISYDIDNNPKSEDEFFEAMCQSLEVLKEIHRSRGENVDEVPVFTKRKTYDTTIINY